MIDRFMLPADRAELMKRLSEKGGGHGEMMMEMMRRGDVRSAEDVWKSLRPSESGPLIVYVHVPFCVSRCSFCGFYRNRADDAAIEAYVERLLVEIDRVADEGVFTRKPVNVVYFGGGTPTALTAEQIRKTVGKLHERFRIAPDCEFTIEGRLFAFDDERVRACLESGVNRLSFGVQSFETKLRQSLGRRLSREETLERLARIKEICGDRVALVADLIYGLPGQTQSDWMERNVKTAHFDSALDAVDLYSLKVVPGMPLARRLAKEGNWSEDERLARHAEASDWLAAHGWTQLSTTHWGRNSLERNLYNTYAKTGVDMVPFGCGAGGFIGDWSLMQEISLDHYVKAVDEGRKPLANVVANPPMRRDAIRFTRMTDLGWFCPEEIPETDFSPIIDNWTAAGVWTPMAEPAASSSAESAGRSPGRRRCRLTRLGEYYQPKVNSMLIGFHMASCMGALTEGGAS